MDHQAKSVVERTAVEESVVEESAVQWEELGSVLEQLVLDNLVLEQLVLEQLVLEQGVPVAQVAPPVEHMVELSVEVTVDRNRTVETRALGNQLDLESQAMGQSQE
jgi:hypothetical protein